MAVLADTAKALVSTALSLCRAQGMTVDILYRRIKGTTPSGDRITQIPAPTTHALYAVDDAPAYGMERETQAGMQRQEDRPEKTYLLDGAQFTTIGFEPAENDELDVTDQVGTRRYRIDQIETDPIKASYRLGCRPMGA